MTKNAGAALKVAVLSAIGLALYSPFEAAEWASVAQCPTALRAVVGFLLGGTCAYFAWTKRDKRLTRFAAWGAGLLALSCVVGMELQNNGTLRLSVDVIVRGAACWLGLSTLGTSVFACVLRFGGRWLKRVQDCGVGQALEHAFPIERGSRRLFWLAWVAILLCWIPVWLAYFPILGNYDLASHMAQCVSGEYNTMHPLLYTLLLKGFLLLGGERHELSMALLAIFQMLCLSASLAHAVAAMRRYDARAWLCVLAVLYCAAFPVFPLMAISSTKDVLFSALALLLAVELYAMLREPTLYLRSPARVAAYLAAGTGMGLLRYNGVVSLALYAVGFSLLWRGVEPSRASRRIRVSVLALMAGVLLLCCGGTKLLNAATDASSSFVTVRDMASLPSQQLIRVALSTDDADEYADIMRWYGGETALQRYRPRLADYTKKYIDVDHDNGWRGFYETWLRVGLRHPKAYIEAFLELNRGLWFADDLSHSDIYVTEDPTFGYLTNNQVSCEEEGYPIRYESRLPQLQAWLNALTAQNGYLQWPILRWLFSVGAQAWLTLLLCLIAAYRHDCAAKWTALWPLALALVLLASPCVLVRYTLPIFFINPMLLLAVTRRGLQENAENTAASRNELLPSE